MALKRSVKDYFDYLCDLTYCDSLDNNFSNLFWTLFRLDFEWSDRIPLDENRAKDGLEIRKRYNEDAAHPYDEDRPCSFLEFLIGLSERMAYIQGWDPQFWFYELIKNLEFDDLKNEWWEVANGPHIVEMTVKTVLERRYKANGYGGLFPLSYPKNDQRNAEIWYQMQSYLDENYTIL